VTCGFALLGALDLPTQDQRTRQRSETYRRSVHAELVGDVAHGPTPTASASCPALRSLVRAGNPATRSSRHFFLLVVAYMGDGPHSRV